MYYKVHYFINKSTKEISGQEGATPPKHTPTRHVCVQRFYSQLRPCRKHVCL